MPGLLATGLRTLQDAVTATGNGNLFDVAGDSAIALRVVGASGLSSGTVAFEGTIDGSNFDAVFATRSDSLAVATTYAVSADDDVLFFVNIAGLMNFRARVSAISAGSGSITVTGQAVPNSPYPMSTFIQGMAASDAADPGSNPVKIGAKAIIGNRPSVSDDDLIELSADRHGHLFTLITNSANNTTPAVVHGADADAKSSGDSLLGVHGRLAGFAPDGSWDRLRTVGDAAPGLGALKVSPTGHNLKYITSAASTAVMAAAGVLHTITINGVGADGTITLYNDPDSADTPFGIITVVASGFASVTLHYDIYLSAGLFIVNSSAVNITVSYAL